MEIDLRKFDKYVNVPPSLPSVIETSKIFFDTRKPISEGIYLPLQGGNFDGEDFIAQIKDSHFFFSTRSDFDIPYYHLKIKGNQFLRILAKEVALSFTGKKIAITGTCGKTTTKELLFQLLSPFYKVHKTEGNLNNLFGVPFTLLKLQGDEDFSIVELGTNHFGEIEQLASIYFPHYSLITNLGEGHTQFLGGIEGVLKEKTSLWHYTQLEGWTAMDFELWQKFQQDFKLSIPLFWLDTSEIKILNVSLEEGSKVFFPKIGEFKISAWSKGIITNIFLALKFIISHNWVSREKISNLLSNLSLVGNRFEIDKYGHFYFINDFYNSNGLSLLNGLEFLEKLEFKGKKVVVLGDLKELSEKDLQDIYQRVASILKEFPVEVFLFGENILSLKKYYPSSRFYAFKEKSLLIDDLKNYLKRQLTSDKLICYFKGSRAMKLEEVVEELRNAL